MFGRREERVTLQILRMTAAYEMPRSQATNPPVRVTQKVLGSNRILRRRDTSANVEALGHVHTYYPTDLRISEAALERGISNADLGH